MSGVIGLKMKKVRAGVGFGGSVVAFTLSTLCLLGGAFGGDGGRAHASASSEGPQRGDSVPLFPVSARAFLTQAVNKPLPMYPAAALQSGKKGVAVAKIVCGIDGSVESSEILQSPSPDIGNAVQSALARWTFRPLNVRGVAVKLAGKVVFYFDIASGKGGTVTLAEPAMAHVAGDSGVEEISARELASHGPGTCVLDIRDRAAYDRGHHEGAVNIPADEVAARASRELRRDQQIVLDATVESVMLCRAAARVLGDLGFVRVMILRG